MNACPASEEKKTGFLVGSTDIHKTPGLVDWPGRKINAAWAIRYSRYATDLSTWL